MPTGRIGLLTVRRNSALLEMDFPAYRLTSIPVTNAMEEAIDIRPPEAYLGRVLLFVLPEEQAVRSCTPNLKKISELDGLLLHITAKGSGLFDCVSRSFGPKLQIPEDPVCGSGHCHIFP